jgi:glutathione S-transferase
MYVVVGNLRSRALRVIWALEELGLPYEIRHATPRSEAARAANPSGKVPTLIAEGVAIPDSTAIVQFLADRHGCLTHPAGTIARALQDSVTQFALDEIDGPLWLAAKHSFVLPEAERVPAVKPAARAEYARALAALERRLGDREFVAGEDFTVPDLILGHCAGWAETARFDPPEGAVAAYFARIRARPALARAVAAGEAAAAAGPASSER